MYFPVPLMYVMQVVSFIKKDKCFESHAHRKYLLNLKYSCPIMYSYCTHNVLQYRISYIIILRRRVILLHLAHKFIFWLHQKLRITTLFIKTSFQKTSGITHGVIPWMWFQYVISLCRIFRLDKLDIPSMKSEKVLSW